MIIDGELFLSPGVVELDTKEPGVGMEFGRLFKAQLLGKEQLVVTGGDRVAHRQARDRLPQPAAAHADIVGVVQGIQKLFQLARRVLVVQRQILALVHAIGHIDHPG